PACRLAAGEKIPKKWTIGVLLSVAARRPQGRGDGSFVWPVKGGGSPANEESMPWSIGSVEN
ncbi:MAG TPA: hypothetical protein VGD86_08790, partial [Devosia sp.]